MKLIILFFLLGIVLFTHAQDTLTVEKSIAGFQIGLYNAYAYKEVRLKNRVTFRGEIGLESGFVWVPFSILVAPSVGLETRYYYNMARRLSKSKPISNNSANYFALGSLYIPTMFSKNTNINLKTTRVVLYPYWGLRRPIGKHFSFEFGLGVIAPITRNFSYSPYGRIRFGLNF